MTMEELVTVTKLMNEFDIKSINNKFDFTTLTMTDGAHIDVGSNGDWLRWGPDGEFVKSRHYQCLLSNSCKTSQSVVRVLV